MLNKLTETQERWRGKHTVIDKWLDERKQLLVEFCQLSGLTPFEDRVLPSFEQLQGFCQLLMDYVSAGHFEVYEKVVAQCQEHGEESIKLAQQLYPLIADTTDAVLQFNDIYTDKKRKEEDIAQRLDDDLSKLGEKLATRIELEDQLIQTLYAKHPAAA